MDRHYPGPYPVVKWYLEPGDKGENVIRLQNYLNWYTDGAFFKECGGADGVYGKNTLKYVNKMLTDFFGASEADGKVGNKTIAKMKEYTKPVGPTPPTPGGHYTGKYPEVRLVKSNAQVVADTIKWAKMVANNNSFHYGHGQYAHKAGCYFCKTEDRKKGHGIVDWERTWVCNTFVTSAFAHGGCVPSILALDLNCRCFDWDEIKSMKEFTKVSGTPKAGDVLCGDGHMALSLGGKKIIHAAHEDDNKRNSESWNSSIGFGNWVDKYYDPPKVYRFIGSVNADIIIRHGEVSDRIYDLQRYLDWYFRGEFFKECGQPDGIYGDNTYKYVVRMQTDFFGAKEADGTIGNKTIAKMREVVR